MNHHIIIKGYINGNKFMNSLYNRIEKMFKNQDEFFIEASENFMIRMMKMMMKLMKIKM